ncbi:MAG: hypothetical protein AAFV19_12770 [Pseudomonadota bacterium]
MRGFRMMISAVIVVAGTASVSAQPLAPVLNDYPTEARADYVFACMAANGQTRALLLKCSCSIDVIASILPYEEYVSAETVLSMRQTAGERMAIFRTAERAKGVVADLRRAQAEAEIRCF